MDIRHYQAKAIRTVNTNLSENEQLSNLCMGLCGETGEIVDYVKKHLYHGHKLDLRKLTEEISDVMWYLTNLATFFELPMCDILDENIKKLEERYPEGFSVEKSINRKEYNQEVL